MCGCDAGPWPGSMAGSPYPVSAPSLGGGAGPPAPAQPGLRPPFRPGGFPAGPQPGGQPGFVSRPPMQGQMQPPQPSQAFNRQPGAGDDSSERINSNSMPRPRPRPEEPEVGSPRCFSLITVLRSLTYRWLHLGASQAVDCMKSIFHPTKPS